MFLLNSRLGLFTAALLNVERPFSRSYGTILPSSLTRVIPRVLEFSSRLPVSVYGTGTFHLTRGFSWQCEIVTFVPTGLRIVPRLWCLTDLPIRRSRNLHMHFHPHASLSSCVPPLFKRWIGGTGISTCYPSPTPFGLGLGPD